MTVDSDTNTSSQESHNDTQHGVSWLQLVRSFERRYAALIQLVMADVQLSVKALFVCLFCLLLMSGLALVSWCGLLAIVAFALHAIGLNWFTVATLVLAFNIVMLLVVRSIFNSSKKELALSQSLKAIFQKTS
ncbi:hypothetical protein DS2_06171 [Catenovulum agarivorans DS-2]|uniref:Phage holin family protein n=1 Tax=Catenovulum agarivorans DS-2 TaxID=1328313 RepID=W7QD78_9ALTE|nr:hypothetical protein [Catenovulum agarivorans]EWH10854.1 hypothetical protein DS2_06171 [Catenovulum agarivorans DS-2]